MPVRHLLTLGVVAALPCWAWLAWSAAIACPEQATAGVTDELGCAVATMRTFLMALAVPFLLGLFGFRHSTTVPRIAYLLVVAAPFFLLAGFGLQSAGGP